MVLKVLKCLEWGWREKQRKKRSEIGMRQDKEKGRFSTRENGPIEMYEQNYFVPIYYYVNHNVLISTGFTKFMYGPGDETNATPCICECYSTANNDDLSQYHDSLLFTVNEYLIKIAYF